MVTVLISSGDDGDADKGSDEVESRCCNFNLVSSIAITLSNQAVVNVSYVFVSAHLDALDWKLPLKSCCCCCLGKDSRVVLYLTVSLSKVNFGTLPH